MTQYYSETKCVRHPGEVTGLRCGRCNDPICPRCLVQSPVGTRCPKCAAIGRPAAVTATRRDLLQASSAAILVGVAQGAIVGAISGLLWSFLNIGLLGALLIAALFFVTGTISGMAVKRAGRYKIDARLRYIAAIAVLISYGVAIFVGVRLFGVDVRVFVGFLPLIGFALGVLRSMQQAR